MSNANDAERQYEANRKTFIGDDLQGRIVSNVQGREHQHIHNIPIEWRELPNSNDGYRELRYIDRQRPITYRVTKLACQCGDIKLVEEMKR